MKAARQAEVKRLLQDIFTELRTGFNGSFQLLQGVEDYADFAFFHAVNADKASRLRSRNKPVPAGFAGLELSMARPLVR